MRATKDQALTVHTRKNYQEKDDSKEEYMLTATLTGTISHEDQ